MHPALDTFLWALALLYVLHIAEKAMVGAGYAAFVRKHVTEFYDNRLFFMHHGLWLFVLVAGILFFSRFGQGWIVIPLGLGFSLMFNAISLSVASLRYRAFVPGLGTALTAWPCMFFLIRHPVHAGHLSVRYVVIAALLGLGIALWSTLTFAFLRKEAENHC